MITIGFAQKMYTLWDVQQEPQYVLDAYGNYHLSHIRHLYFYIQNISMDKTKAFEKYPDAKFDENLKGKTNDFSRDEQKELTTDIIWFGRYKGRLLTEIADLDFQYILWLYENNGRYSNAIHDLPQYKEHVNNIKIQEDKAIAACASIEVDSPLDIYGTTNGYNLEQTEDGKINGCWFKCNIMGTEEQINVHVNDCARIDGRYPYLMPMVNGKYRKTKHKAFEIMPRKITRNTYWDFGTLCVNTCIWI